MKRGRSKFQEEETAEPKCGCERSPERPSFSPELEYRKSGEIGVWHLAFSIEVGIWHLVFSRI